MSKPVRLGLIGCGRIGQLHARNIVYGLPEASLVAVADALPEAAEACATPLGIEAIYEDANQLLDRDDLDGVLICAPTDTHAPLIIAAAQAGKHIFCEKPIAHDLESIDNALAAVEQAGVILQIGFNRRFDRTFRRVRQAIVNGEIGEPHLLHIFSRDPAPPPLDYLRRSGGLFMDMTIHDFDMARFLSGSEVVELFALGAVRIDPAIGEVGDIDTALITLVFENGLFATIDNSRQAVYGYDQRVEVFGSLGAIRTENEYPNSALISTATEIRRDKPFYFFLERYAESFTEEIRAFVRAITAQHPPPVTGEDGRAATLLALAAERSLAEGRPIRLR